MTNPTAAPQRIVSSMPEDWVTQDELRQFFMEYHRFSGTQATNHARTTILRWVNGLGDVGLVACCSNAGCNRPARACRCDGHENTDGRWVHANRDVARWRISKDNLIQLRTELDEGPIALPGYTREYTVEYITRVLMK